MIRGALCRVEELPKGLERLGRHRLDLELVDFQIHGCLVLLPPIRSGRRISSTNQVVIPPVGRDIGREAGA